MSKTAFPDPAGESLDSKGCARVLKALGDPTRLRILRLLVGERRNVSQMVSALGVDQPTISHHLAHLRRSGLVAESRMGRRVIYRLHPSVSRSLSQEIDKINLGCCAVELSRE